MASVSREPKLSGSAKRELLRGVSGSPCQYALPSGKSKASSALIRVPDVHAEGGVVDLLRFRIGKSRRGSLLLLGLEPSGARYRPELLRELESTRVAADETPA